ncbi:MAG: polysaccharide biosynthesis tyrosine autokinase [Gammaproteobacteria bacterium]|nr:polysaccharide biosynthesis tyrosine autokinase [Gammaproteobacteria bacterium]
MEQINAASNLSIPAGTDDVGLGEILTVIRRRISVLGGIVFAALVMAGLALLLLTPRFTGEVLILIESQENNSVSLDSVVAGLSGDAESVQSEAYVLGSRALADRVVQRMNLENDREFNESLSDSAARRPDAGLATAQEYSKLLDRFQERLEITPQENSRVIAVRFSSENPQKAADIANALADEYIQSRLETKFEIAERANSWLGKRIEGLREKLAEDETKIEAMRQEYGLLEGNGFTLATQQLVELNTQLVMARTARAEAEARLRQTRRLVDTAGGVGSASEVLDSPLIQRLREQEIEVERRVAELSSELGELHPRMVQLRAEALDLQTRIKSEVSKIVTGLQNQVDIARARERSLQTSLNESKGTVGAGNQNNIKLQALQREADAARTLLDTMLAREKETLYQKDMGFQQPDVDVFSPATIPAEPSFPSKGVVIGLALMGSLFLGLMAILILELLDSGFRSGEQFEQVTGTPSIGFVPMINKPDNYSSLAAYVAGRPGAAFGESVRTLNWSLSLAFPDQPPQVVLITSSVPGEGKSTIASSLATVQSVAGQRVVLIDADIRRPACHEITGVEKEPGLTNVLAGEVDINNVLQASAWSSLKVIPAGMPTMHATNVLGSKKMAALLDVMRDKFDLIVIDSPPLMAAADARILSRLSDATILAVRWGSTRRQAVKMSVRQLLAAGAPLAGGLLTMVNAKKHAQYSYGDSGAYAGELEKYYVG